MRRLAWRLYLGSGALLIGAYYLLPDGPGAVLNVVVGASAVAAILLGLRWHRPPRPLPWWLIAAAQGLFVAGDALFSVNELILGIEPFPSLADALYLPGYPLLAAGLALLALSRSTGRRDWAGLTDSAIIAIGFGLLSWVLVMVPYFADPSLGLVELLVSLAYPVGDVLLLALAARLATSPGRRTTAYRLLIASLAVTFAADTLFSALTLSGASVAVTDGMYLAAYLLLGASGLHPSMAGLSEPAQRRLARLGRGRLLAMGAAALVAPALLIVQRLQGSELQVGAIAGAWAVLFVLVMVRMAGLVGGSSGPRPSAGGCWTGPCRRPRRNECRSPACSTTGPSSAWPSSPTTWNGPSSGCSATRPPLPGSSTPRRPCPPRSRGCGS